MATETVTVRLESEDDSVELAVPTALIEVLGEGDESPADVVGDVATLGLAQQAHGMVHHGHGEAEDELQAAEAHLMDLFERRFGQSFAEVTGHNH